MSEEAASTPSAQQQHNPPSLPTSPHPKRVKTGDLLNPSEPTTDYTTTLPTMSGRPPQTGAPGADYASTPTPTNPNPIPAPDLSTLPPVGNILPSISSNPAIIANGGGSMIPNPAAIPMPPMPSSLPAAVPPLLIKKLSENATTPTRGSAFAAGYDLYAASPLTLQAKSKGLVSTDLSIAVPPGTYGRVAPRSGLASKHFLDTGAGVIDADYRGEVKVLMFNFSDVDYEIKKGERVAQLVLERIVTPEVVEVQELEESVRGMGGFGSTGYV